MVNKQVFFSQNLTPTIFFPKNTAEVRHIYPKLSENNRQCALSWKVQRKRFNEGWSVNYGASTIITPSVSSLRVFKSSAITIELDEIKSWNFLPSIYVFSYFPFGFEGRMWDLIVSVPDHCLSFYFSYVNVSYQVNMSEQEWESQLYCFISYLPLIKTNFKGRNS